MRISFFSRILDFVSPRSCAVCGSRLAIDERVLCSFCNMQMPRTGYAMTPLDNEMCRLFYAKINIQRAAALFFYQPDSRESKMIYRLKYCRQPEIGLSLGRMAATEWLPAGFFDGIDAIVPVPLNRKRQRQRGYNQSSHIARGVSDITSIEIVEGAVERIRATDSQTSMSPQQRIGNVENAFSLRRPGLVSGKHVLVVDDVVTTGATISSLGRELMKAGGVAISVLSLGFTKD